VFPSCLCCRRLPVQIANNPLNRDVIAGMDASQMDESLYEAQWQGEEDYNPFSKGNIELE